MDAGDGMKLPAAPKKVFGERMQSFSEVLQEASASQFDLVPLFQDL
jgi:hypothetical protein